MGYIDVGKKEGGKIATGGNALEGGIYSRGNYIQPTMVGAFTYVMPASSCCIALNARFTFLVYMDELRPYCTPLSTERQRRA